MRSGCAWRASAFSCSKRRFLALLAAGAALLQPAVLCAQGLAAELEVARDSGTELCPDRAALAARVAALGSPAHDAEPLRLDVRFRRELDEYVAIVVSTGRKSGVRTLRTPGPGCDELAGAVTVTLAVLLDVPLLSEPLLGLPRPDPPWIAPVAPRPRSAPAENPRQSSLSGGFHVGAGYGVVGAGWSSSLGLGAALERGSFRLGLDAFSVLPRDVAFSSGFVSVWLSTARLQGCIWAARAERPRFGVCPGLALGAVRGHGVRFDVERSSWQPWAAAMLGVAGVLPIRGRLALRLQLSAWVPLLQNRFRVDGIGVGYQSEQAAGLFEFGPELRFW